MALTAGVVVAAQIGAKAVRDALFLSTHPTRDLPLVMLASVAVSLAAVLVMTRGLSRVGPGRAVPLVFALSALLFGAEWLLLPRSHAAVSLLTYLHVAALGGVMVSGFWSVVSERFDPHTAKQLIGRINVGGAVGGVIGGVVVQRCAAWVDIRTMLLGLAVANGIGGLFVAAVARRSAPPPADVMGTLDALHLFRDMPYLRLLGALVALTGAAAALSDFAFKSVVALRFANGEAMAGFFALFYGIASLATLVVQAGFAKRALERLGLAGTIAILPGGFLLVGLAGALVTRLATVVALRGVESTLSHSLFRSAYELFYTPLPAAKKRATKAIVDVAFDRAGDAVASGVVLMAVLVLPARAASIAIATAAGASALALWISFRLHGGYVGTLGEELRTNAIVLAPEEIVDATTRSTLAASSLAIDRHTLMQQIARLREARSAAPSPASPASPAPPPATSAPSSDAARVLASAAELLSEDLDRALRALARPLDPRLVPLVIGLAARPELRRNALAALRRARLRIAGQIADALLDPATPASVRSRLPSLLALVGDQRAADALVDGLGDSRFDVRVRCARALARVLEDRPDTHLSRTRLILVATRQLDTVAADPAAGNAVLAHVFDVLALAIGDRTVRLAWDALGTGDARLRGTALEYLENVLPETVRGCLSRHLGDGRSERRTARPRATLVDELRARMASRRGPAIARPGPHG
jgi:HEAT repeat protein